jgi:hypothetical protein
MGDHCRHLKTLITSLFTLVIALACLTGFQRQAYAACEPDGCFSLVLDTSSGDATDCDTLSYNVTVNQSVTGNTGTSCNDIENLILPIACEHVSAVFIDGTAVPSSNKDCVGGLLEIEQDLTQDNGTHTYDVIVELKSCMCQQPGSANIEEEFSNNDQDGGPSCDHPVETTGSADCECGNDEREGTEQCDGTDDEACIDDEACNQVCRCAPPPDETSCGQNEVDILFMIDRTGSVSNNSDTVNDDLEAEAQAIKDLLQHFIDEGIDNVNVAIGRFPAPEAGEPYDAAMLTGDQTCGSVGNFATDAAGYMILQCLLTNHFIDPNHADYESSAGNTNLQSANTLGLSHLMLGSSPFQFYFLFSDGDTNRPTPTNTSDHSARVSANALKAAFIRNIMVAFDASGNDGDDTSNGGDGSGDTANRLLMSDMATTSTDNGNGLDGCGGNGCTGPETSAENADGDDLYIAAGGSELGPIFDALTEIIDCPDIDNNKCTPEECNEQTDLCVSGAAIPGCQPCTTGEECNTADLCDAERVCVIADGEESGTCEDDPNHEPTDCSNDENLCDGTLACNPNTGQCENGPAPAPCDDSNVCTTEMCNPATGACDTTNNTDPCTDNNLCTLPDVCAGGSCQPGELQNCNDQNACTNDSCDPATGCLNPPKTCNDGLACTTDSCNPASGCTTAPVACPDDTNVCTDPACTEPNGCGFVNNNHTEPCYTGPQGTENVGICHGGTKSCVNGVLGACSGEVTPGTEICDGIDNDCDGEIDEGGNTSCDDGNACNGVEACQNGACTNPADVVCDDQNACNGLEVCDPANGQCSNPPDVVCDDQNACNGLEVCDPANGQCSNPPDVNCADNRECTVDTCNEPTGACTNNNESCQCNGDTECDDQNPCTNDTCNISAGTCVFTPDDTNSCSDGDACNGVEVCDAGDCMDAEDKVCDDGRECSEDECVEPNGACLFDTNGCACAVDADCDDSNPCTDDSCDVGSGTCSSEPLTNEFCDNGVPREPEPTPAQPGAGGEAEGCADPNLIEGTGNLGGCGKTCANLNPGTFSAQAASFWWLLLIGPGAVAGIRGRVKRREA